MNLFEQYIAKTDLNLIRERDNYVWSYLQSGISKTSNENLFLERWHFLCLFDIIKEKYSAASVAHQELMRRQASIVAEKTAMERDLCCQTDNLSVDFCSETNCL